MSHQNENTGVAFPSQSPLPANIDNVDPDSVSGRHLGGRRAFEASSRAREVSGDAMSPTSIDWLAPSGVYGTV